MRTWLLGLATASAVSFECGLQNCDFTFPLGRFWYDAQGVSNIGSIKDIYKYNGGFEFYFVGNSELNIPKIQSNISFGAQPGTKWQIRGRTDVGGYVTSTNTKITNDIDTNVNYNNKNIDIKLHGAWLKELLNGNLAGTNQELAYTQKGPGSMLHDFTFNIHELIPASLKVVFQVKGKTKNSNTFGNKDFNAKIEVQGSVRSGKLNTYKFNLNNRYTMNGERKAMAGLLAMQFPTSVMQEGTISEKLSSPINFMIKERYCTGSRCNISRKTKSKATIKVHVTGNRLKMEAMIKYFGLANNGVLVFDMPVDPAASLEPLMDKIEDIKAKLPCKFSSWYDSQDKLDYIQNKDNLLCVKALFHADHTIQLVSKKQGLDCDSLFNTYIDFNTELSFNKYSYPASAVDLCKDSVRQLNNFMPQIRNIMDSLMNEKSKQDLERALSAR